MFLRFFVRQCVHSAFYTLFHHSASYGIGFVHIARKVIIVCAATAAANEFRKAILAVLAREKTGICEFFPYGFVQNPVKHIAH